MGYKVVEHKHIRWVDIGHPSSENIRRLGKEFPQFHPLALEDCYSHMERPKIDDYDDHLFIVMQFPLWDASNRISRSAEVDIFIGKGFLVTVHRGELTPINKFRERLIENEDERDRSMRQGASRLMHDVIDRLVDYLFPILAKVDINILNIEDSIFSVDTRKIVREISFVRRDIIALRRIIRPQVLILANLENIDRPFIRDDLDDYFGDILDHLTKARDIIEDDAEMIIALADTTDTLSSYRINEVMRTLTIISVIMLPMTLVTGIFGMNVPLPFQKSASSLFGILGIMLVISCGMLAYFRHKHWL